MKFNRIILMFIFLFQLSTHAAGPIIVGPGGGTGEFYLLLGLRNFSKIIELCSIDKDCSDKLSSELELLKSEELSRKTILHFLTSKEMGSDIFQVVNNFEFNINKDELFIKENSQIRPFVYDEAINFLLDLLGGELKIELNKIDEIKKRIGLVTSAINERSRFADDQFKQFTLVRVLKPHSVLIIEDSTLSQNSSTMEIPFVEQLNCLDSTDVNSPLNQIKIESAYWMSLYAIHAEKLGITGEISYKCLNKKGQLEKFISKFQLFIPVIYFPEENYGLDEAKIEIVQTRIKNKN